MKRDTGALAGYVYDVLVIGGGITGACLAHDAACRGFRVAMVEKGDFGAATSSASSKLLHGGVRYLQQLRLGKVRESALERVYFQNLAPHLTRYVPFVVPSYRALATSRPVLAAGMTLYEALCLGQNRHLRDPGKRVPRGHGLSPSAVRDLVPGIDTAAVTGGRVLFESYMHSSERMTLAFVDGAVRSGAAVANYVRVRGFLRDAADPTDVSPGASARGGRGPAARVTGVIATDEIDGRDLEVRARVVVNAAGPWIREINDELGARSITGVITAFSRGAHLVTRPVTRDCAVVLPTSRRFDSVIDRGGRHIFVIPWRGRSLIGTSYGPYDGNLDQVRPTEDDVATLVGEVNAILGPATLAPGDVRHAFAGIYPLDREDVDPEVYQGTGDFQVIDHEETDGIPGLLSVFGAKYTTARLLAERALDILATKLQGDWGPCRTRTEPLPSGNIDDIDAFRKAAIDRHRYHLPGPVVDELVTNHGTAVDDVVALAAADPPLGVPLADDVEVIGAQVVHAVRHEMAYHLDDVVFRRTGLGTVGHPGDEALRSAARLTATELGWDDSRLTRELDRVTSLLDGVAATLERALGSTP